MSSAKKLFTVFGATGNQGRSVINHILETSTLSQTFSLRGITRDPAKPSAAALTSKGVEMVAADMNDPQSLAAAIKGSYAVFAVTNYWESMSAETEVKQGKAVTDASIAAGVKLLIWSALPNVTDLTGGNLKHMAHFDSKADVATYIEQAKTGTGLAAAFVQPGFFMSNIKDMINPSPQDKVPTLTLPWNATETLVPLFDVKSDTGAFVAGLVSQTPEQVDGKRVLEVSEWATPNEIVKVISEVVGNEVRFSEVDPETFQNFLPPAIAQELKENMVLIRDYSYYGVKGQEHQIEGETEQVVGKVGRTSWKKYVQANGPWKW